MLLEGLFFVILSEYIWMFRKTIKSSRKYIFFCELQRNNLIKSRFYVDCSSIPAGNIQLFQILWLIQHLLNHHFLGQILWLVVRPEYTRRKLGYLHFKSHLLIRSNLVNYKEILGNEQATQIDEWLRGFSSFRLVNWLYRR